MKVIATILGLTAGFFGIIGTSHFILEDKTVAHFPSLGVYEVVMFAFMGATPAVFAIIGGITARANPKAGAAWMFSASVIGIVLITGVTYLLGEELSATCSVSFLFAFLGGISALLEGRYISYEQP